MARLLIPTRNRPASLASLLRFVEQRYRSTSVIVSDGSTPEFAAVVEGVCRRSGLDLEYFHTDSAIGLFDRLLDTLEHIPDEVVVFGSDDDYPLMDRNQEASTLVRGDVVCALGGRINLDLVSPGVVQIGCRPARSLIDESPSDRITAFARWSVPLSYGAVRKSVLVDRFELASKVFVPGLFDFAAGVADCIAGKVVAIPDIAFISTRNYGHSYLRPKDELFFLERSDEVRQLIHELSHRLGEVGVLSPENDPVAVVSAAFGRELRELCGDRFQRREGFSDSDEFRSPSVGRHLADLSRVVQSHRRKESDLFDLCAEVLRSVADVAQSADNRGDANRSDRLPE